ncbi:hypothetical protein LEP1GSC161_1398 [Leptospira santarosai str. CBC1416]|uniref:Uncharacterized protein n=1 Tax=Leptospira santarosai str. CBC1416 TaxID=1193059 RepID=M6W5V0_9LEPT|nr:hypothetical protein LEP1GSC175_2682 [Leptospira santarosai str. HAI821]EMO57138.1 hypothetical protein LEP1GSC161_1398 [Leptospira santarosai str. CBC1416]
MFQAFENFIRAPLSNGQLLYHATWFTTLGFEIVYLSTFYFTEFFFRKFIIRYLSFAGKYHAVGMGTLIYGMVHFEKPRGDSQFFFRRFDNGRIEHTNAFDSRRTLRVYRARSGHGIFCGALCLGKVVLILIEE